MKDKLAKHNLLVVDDDESIQLLLKSLLKNDYTVHLASNLDEARNILKKEYLQLVILDLKLENENGLSLLKEIKEQETNIQVIILSASDDLQVAIQAIKEGAFDYLTKDFEYEELKSRVEKAISCIIKNKQIQYLREEVKQHQDLPLIFGKSTEMARIKTIADCIAPLPATVLIHGETGCGKELIARYIHAKSHLARMPFVTVNMAAIPPELLESTLFGHEKGAFTGAIRSHQGKFELAHGGTLFMDEIGELRIDLQSKLLRALQENEIERVGGSKSIPIDIRLIAATNCDLKEKVKKKEFREDLFYRLNVVPILLPPLRNRTEDLPELLDFFIERYNRKFNRKISSVSPEVQHIFQNYPWPGNIRELEHLIERMVALCHKNHLSLSDIPLEYQMHTLTASSSPSVSSTDEHAENDHLQKSIDTFEKTFLLRTLEENSWNQTLASKRLGIHRKTLEYKIKRLELANLIDQEKVKL